MSSDVRLVTDASQSDAVKLSAQSPRYGPSHTGLTYSWGPHEAEDGSLKTIKRHEFTGKKGDRVVADGSLNPSYLII